MSGTSINLESLQELKDIMEDDFTVLIETFISDGKEQINLLEVYIDAGDFTKIKAGAHTLKGSSSNIGANKLSEICFKLEKKGSDHDASDMVELLNQLRDEYENVKVILEQQI